MRLRKRTEIFQIKAEMTLVVEGKVTAMSVLSKPQGPKLGWEMRTPPQNQRKEWFKRERNITYRATAFRRG